MKAKIYPTLRCGLCNKVMRYTEDETISCCSPHCEEFKRKYKVPEFSLERCEDTREEETFSKDQIIHAIWSFLDLGEKRHQDTYYAGCGFAARALKHHLKHLKGE